jgi:hypothetical protein
MTILIQSNPKANVTLDLADFLINTLGAFSQPNPSTVGFVDVGMKEVGQLIFAQNPSVNVINDYTSNPCITDLDYNLFGKSSAEIQILVGLYPVSDQDISNMNQTLLTHGAGALTSHSNAAALTTFDYTTALQQWSVSYVVNRDSEMQPKFAKDPAFSLVFINNEVAIFKVKANVNPGS